MLIWTGVAPAASLRLLLEAWVAEYFSTTGVTAYLKLFQNDITPGVGTLLADLTQANFTNYSEKEILLASLTDVKSDVIGNAYVVSLTNVLFEQSADTVSNVVYGWYLVDRTRSNLLLAGRFANPINFDHAGKSIVVELGFRVPVGSLVGGEDTTESE